MSSKNLPSKESTLENNEILPQMRAMKLQEVEFLERARKATEKASKSSRFSVATSPGEQEDYQEDAKPVIKEAAISPIEVTSLVIQNKDIMISELLREKLKKKEQECEQLRSCLEKKILEFRDFKEKHKAVIESQQKAFLTHNEYVEDLKTLAARDRAWLESETAKRLAASKSKTSELEDQVKRMQQRRASTGW